MTDEPIKKEEVKKEAESPKPVEAAAPDTKPGAPATGGPATGGPRGGAGNAGRPSGKREFKKNKRTSRRRNKPRSEFDQKILDIRRVTRVSAGGRRFSFSVALVVGNKKGKIGVGTGKAGDTALAIEKAAKNAQKNTIQIKTTETMSIPHEVDAKFNSAKVIIMPAPRRGIIAGSALRDIIELGGLNDINGKIISGSKNKLNIAKATIKAFSSLEKTVKEDLKKDKKMKGLEDEKRDEKASSKKVDSKTADKKPRRTILKSKK